MLHALFSGVFGTYGVLNISKCESHIRYWGACQPQSTHSSCALPPPLPPVRCCSQMAIVFIPYISNQWNVFWLLSSDCSPRNVLAMEGFNVVAQWKHKICQAVLKGSREWVNPWTVTVHTGHRLPDKPFIFRPISLWNIYSFLLKGFSDWSLTGNLYVTILSAYKQLHPVQAS